MLYYNLLTYPRSIFGNPSRFMSSSSTLADIFHLPAALFASAALVEGAVFKYLRKERRREGKKERRTEGKKENVHHLY